MREERLFCERERVSSEREGQREVRGGEEGGSQKGRGRAYSLPVVGRSIMRSAAFVLVALLAASANAQDAQMLACQSDLVSMSDQFNRYSPSPLSLCFTVCVCARACVYARVFETLSLVGSGSCNSACCRDPSNCASGAPSQCDAGCAAIWNPFCAFQPFLRAFSLSVSVALSLALCFSRAPHLALPRRASENARREVSASPFLWRFAVVIFPCCF